MVDWSFSDSADRDLTHGLHPWPAKFIPQIPRIAISSLTTPGGRVLDPFGGCGTTALEATREGRNAVTVDLNPVASLIAEAKTHPPTDDQCMRILEWAALEAPAWRAPLKSVDLPEIPNLEKWFKPEVASSLAAIKNSISEFDIAQNYLLAVFSSIIVSVSNQESETRYRSVPSGATSERTADRFMAKLMSSIRMAREFNRDVDAPGETTVISSDIRRLSRSTLGSFQLAVFSPPYPNAFDYHLYHRFRLFWLGYDPKPIKHQEIGAHLRPDGATKWANEMRESMTVIADCLDDDGHCLIVVGDGISKGEAIPAGDLLWEIGSDLGMQPEFRVERNIDSSKKSFNQSDARLASEHVLLFSR